MADVEITRMSSRGQVVIPLDIREALQWTEGTPLAVMSKGSMLILKKVSTPTKEDLLKEFGDIVSEGSNIAAEKRIRQSDVQKIIHVRRGVADGKRSGRH